MNFIKICLLLQKLIWGQTHRQEGDLISLMFFLSFRKEIKTKIKVDGVDWSHLA